MFHLRTMFHQKTIKNAELKKSQLSISMMSDEFVLYLNCCFSFPHVCSSASEITFVWPVMGMKFMSPFQRGTI